MPELVTVRCAFEGCQHQGRAPAWPEDSQEPSAPHLWGVDLGTRAIYCPAHTSLLRLRGEDLVVPQLDDPQPSPKTFTGIANPAAGSVPKELEEHYDADELERAKLRVGNHDFTVPMK